MYMYLTDLDDGSSPHKESMPCSSPSGGKEGSSHCYVRGLSHTLLDNPIISQVIDGCKV